MERMKRGRGREGSVSRSGRRKERRIGITALGSDEEKKLTGYCPPPGAPPG